jgi:CRISPR/Cas system CMR subunit Cmr4 (Cas7 group RAMP superfamily)
VPVLSGTSLAGVIRSQSLRIARTVASDSSTAEEFVRDLFGYMPKPGDMNKRKRASRVTVNESEIGGAYHDLVQSRVKIDRFTGGASETALFTEQPLFGGGFRLKLSVREPSRADIGLLLLVLKDLWTGFVPVGGEVSVGRGRLRGFNATLRHGENEWQLDLDKDAHLRVTPAGGRRSLDEYVNAFVGAMEKHDEPAGHK